MFRISRIWAMMLCTFMYCLQISSWRVVQSALDNFWFAVRCPALAVAAGLPEKAAQFANEDARLSHANRVWAENWLSFERCCHDHKRIQNKIHF